MGVYLYRVMSKTRKMHSGESVHEIKFKGKAGTYSMPEFHGERTIPETLVSYDFTPGSEVFKLKAGSNYWWDSHEERRETYGYLVPTAKNRLTIVTGLSNEEGSVLYHVLNGGSEYDWGFGGRVKCKVIVNRDFVNAMITDEEGKLITSLSYMPKFKIPLVDRVKKMSAKIEEARARFIHERDRMDAA